MFVIDQSGTFEWPIQYKTPKPMGGKYEVFEFTATFKRLPQIELEALLKAAAAREMTDAEMLDRVLVGWDGIKTATGEAFAYSDANRRILYDLSGMKAALAYTYLDVATGRAAAKN